MKLTATLTAALLASAAIAMPVTSASAANIQINTQNPVVELSVSEQIDSAPDMASFSTGVETRAPTATAALRQNSAQTEILFKQLKSLGIAEKDLQTSGINLSADYEYVQATNQNRFVGYRVNNQVNVKIRDIAKLGQILDALVSDGGATNLNGPYFSIADDSGLKKQAREKALATAKEQAMIYAKAAGYSDVRMISVSENLYNVSQESAPKMRAVAFADAASVPVAIGQVGTGVSINIAYEMVR